MTTCFKKKKKCFPYLKWRRFLFGGAASVIFDLKLRPWHIPLYPNKPDIFLLIAIVKYNTVIYKNNVIIILWVSLIIFKNLQLACILHYLF